MFRQNARDLCYPPPVTIYWVETGFAFLEVRMDDATVATHAAAADSCRHRNPATTATPCDHRNPLADALAPHLDDPIWGAERDSVPCMGLSGNSGRSIFHAVAESRL